MKLLLLDTVISGFSIVTNEVQNASFTVPDVLLLIEIIIQYCVTCQLVGWFSAISKK